MEYRGNELGLDLQLRDMSDSVVFDEILYYIPKFGCNSNVWILVREFNFKIKLKWWMTINIQIMVYIHL